LRETARKQRRGVTGHAFVALLDDDGENEEEVSRVLYDETFRPVLVSEKGLFVALCIGIFASKLPHIPRFQALVDAVG